MLQTRSASPITLGAVTVTANAFDRLNPDDVGRALIRHARGDWGEVSAEDAAENNRALREGARLLSAYTDREGVKFWIITEADRASTCILLPEDY